MKETYNEAMAQVYEDEGGYSNDAGDPGGPTKYGITIHDARMYWKRDATAADVRAMPKSVAADIYAKHYANPIRYNDLPAGLDYTILDYGINSGISRSVKVLQRTLGRPVTGNINDGDIEACKKAKTIDLINQVWDERVRFLTNLSRSKPQFRAGWLSRCRRGRHLALSLANKQPSNAPTVVATAGGAVGSGVIAASQWPHLWLYIAIGVGAALLIGVLGWYFYRKKKG